MFEFLIHLNETVFLGVNNGWKSPVDDWLIGHATYMGQAEVLVPFILLFLFVADRQQFWRNCLVMVCVTLAGLGVLHLLKFLFATPRPLEYFAQGMKQGRVTVNVMFDQLHWNSFPSGHTQAAFSTAHALGLLWPKNRGWRRTSRVILYTAAALVGLSRIYVGAHFPVDVLGGMLVGVVTSDIVVRLFAIARARASKSPESV